MIDLLMSCGTITNHKGPKPVIPKSSGFKSLGTLTGVTKMEVTRRNMQFTGRYMRYAPQAFTRAKEVI
jgi:hypothetical protein